MPFVSLNLDLDEVSIVRQALALSMAACVCSATSTDRRCATCAACASLMHELERMTARANGAPRHRSIPLPPSLACAADGHDLAFDPSSAMPVGLRVMRGGLCDD
ncbi:MAG TPA: hypothetical protein VFI22_01415 [Thermomicrobiales bacterium]|nr:hypothetical protein [Thermomicrobiales bacterium]